MLTLEERTKVNEGKALQARERRRAKRERPKPAATARDGRQRDPRQRAKDYLSWLHDGIPCIACEIEGPPALAFNPIEAAHLKLAIAAKGWREGGLGPRIHDSRCIPLCQWHHRLAPNACDFGQRKFVDRLGLGDDVADLCRDLVSAHASRGSGAAVIARYVAELSA